MPSHDDPRATGDIQEYEVVMIANGEIEASTIKSALEAAGIPVRLVFEAVTRLLAVTVDGLGAVKIMVPSDRLEEAKTIVDTPAEAIGADAGDEKEDQAPDA